MTIHLPEPVERSINAAVRNGRFPSVEDALVAAWLAFDEPLKGEQSAPAPAQSTTNGEASTPTDKPIWQVFQEISAEVPAEVWDALPTDLSEQHDHYIYGTPKVSDTDR
jgi:Arc/MetJ-type ribon-helix-helix transcriptional regulator